jgi:hypothetical protein
MGHYREGQRFTTKLLPSSDGFLDLFTKPILQCLEIRDVTTSLSSSKTKIFFFIRSRNSSIVYYNNRAVRERGVPIGNRKRITYFQEGDKTPLANNSGPL